MRVVTFKAKEEDHERWKEDARLRDITFGEWVRRKLNSGELPTPRLIAYIEEKKPKKGVCTHRIPPGTWCKRCEVIKK